MGHIISIHANRGGTGKTNVTANLAWLVAGKGRRVAVLDADVPSPGLHVVFGVEKERFTHTLTDFLLGRCTLEETVCDLTPQLKLENPEGAVLLLPASLKPESILKVTTDGYDVGRLHSRLGEFMDALDLDVLLLDTHPGLSQETMLTIAASDTLVILIRPDSQDFHGTAAMVEVAGRLGVPKIYVVANKVVGRLDREGVRQKIREAFGYEVIGVLPLDEDLASLGSRGLFVARHPAHPITMELAAVAERLLQDLAGDGG